MERVLFNLHSKASSFALRNSSARSRSLLEHGVLLVAVCGFGILILSHISFVHRGVSRVWENDDMRPSLSRQIPLSCLRGRPEFQTNADVTHIMLVDEKQSSCYLPDTEPSGIFLSYSDSEGYLLLSQRERSRHSITTQVITISKNDPKCFGEPFLQAIVFNVIGPETVVTNWLLALYNNQGYIYNPRTKNLIDLNSTSSNSLLIKHSYHQFIFKFGVILTSIFLFFITTTLVSFTLRETQDRMLEFTFQLQARVRAQLPHAQLIFTHVVESLVFVPVMVGMMFFLIEFYRGDKLLAFMVLSLVWVCEVFSVVCMRTNPGVHFFPRVFFLLFTLFHVYFFSCPFGFSYTALACTACFLAHSMLFFWNRYELPAVAHGLVTLENPRMASAANAPQPHQHAPTVPPLPEPSRPDQPVRHPLTMRRHNSGQSFPSVSSAGRGGSVRSASVLFNEGDDGDESYMYFMGGEVVMHRDRQAHSSSASLERAGSTGSIGEAASEMLSAGVPQNILAEVGVSAPLAVADDHDSTASDSGTPRRGSSAASRSQSTAQVEPTGTGAEVHGNSVEARADTNNEVDENLTPRWGTASTQRRRHSAGSDGEESSRVEGAPVFPFLKFSWQ